MKVFGVLFVVLCIAGAHLTYSAPQIPGPEKTNDQKEETVPVVETATDAPVVNKVTTEDTKKITQEEVQPNPTQPTEKKPESTIAEKSQKDGEGEDTTTPPETTTPSTTTSTTVKPTTSTTEPTTPTTTTTTTIPTTPSTTTTTTTAPTPTPSPVPSTTTTTVKPDPNHDRSQFSVTAFIGGMVFAFGMMAIGFIAFKFYKARNERNYHTL